MDLTLYEGKSKMANTTFSGPVISQNGFIVGSGSTVSELAVATAALNFPSIATTASADLTITVTGAAVGDYVVLALPASPAAGIVFNAFVSAANTVTIRASNITGSSVDPASATYGVLVIAAA
jgi:hypothetical protein